MFLYLMSAQRTSRKNLSPADDRSLLIGVDFIYSVGVLSPIRSSMLLIITGILGGADDWHRAESVSFAGAVIYSSSVTTQLAQIALPLSPTAESPYHLFSDEHLSGISPESAAAQLSDRARYAADVFILELEISRLSPYSPLLPTMLFTVLVDPKLRALRDWDLMSQRQRH